ncbi:hypothetical protein MTE01_01560 [Microbacterium testaceum]|uniref:Uncharacterized protein n=1 Tax=Microbacterium testaceum TaxID=2033 RepID=A0A4Y3QG87_MICTE|nr:hypothetical protein MTE01_01560 [Microbacterium testaceum]
MLWTLNVQSRTAIAGRGPCVECPKHPDVLKNLPGVVDTQPPDHPTPSRGTTPALSVQDTRTFQKSIRVSWTLDVEAGPVITGRATRRRAHPGAHPRTHPSVRRESTPKRDTQYQHARYWEP